MLSLAPATDESAAGLRDALTTYRAMGMWAFALADCAAVAMTLAARGDERTAAILLGARARHRYRGDASEQVALAVRAQLEASLEGRFAALFEEGERTKASTATALAIDALERSLSGRA